jgi:hypothetical protein
MLGNIYVLCGKGCKDWIIRPCLATRRDRPLPAWLDSFGSDGAVLDNKFECEHAMSKMLVLRMNSRDLLALCR